MTEETQALTGVITKASNTISLDVWDAEIVEVWARKEAKRHGDFYRDAGEGLIEYLDRNGLFGGVVSTPWGKGEGPRVLEWNALGDHGYMRFQVSHYEDGRCSVAACFCAKEPTPSGNPKGGYCLEGEVDWKGVALVLWQILDDIDTMADMFKSNYEGFAKNTAKRVGQRHKYLYSPDGYGLVPGVRAKDPRPKKDEGYNRA